MSAERHRPPGFALPLLLAVVCLSAACATRAPLRLDRRNSYQFPDYHSTVTVVFRAENDWDARLIGEALRVALPKVAAWGTFIEPVTLAVHPSHLDLERAVDRAGFPWLRAWATYDGIQFQAPSTWGGQNVRGRLEDLLTHELTHVMMYQAVGTAGDWFTKPIPLWFREGLATFVAGPGDCRVSRRRLQDYYAGSAFAGDPVSEADSLVQEHPKEVYTASYWLFTDLVGRHGKEKVLAVLAQMKARKGFREAWRDVYGFTVEQFIEDWRQDLLASETETGG